MADQKMTKSTSKAKVRAASFGRGPSRSRETQASAGLWRARMRADHADLRKAAVLVAEGFYARRAFGARGEAGGAQGSARRTAGRGELDVLTTPRAAACQLRAGCESTHACVLHAGFFIGAAKTCEDARTSPRLWPLWRGMPAATTNVGGAPLRAAQAVRGLRNHTRAAR